jgi:hypothetical protein
MNKLIIMASVVVLAASSANCAREGSSDSSSSSILGPSAVGDSSALAAKGGGGGKPGGGTGGTGGLTLVMVADSNANGLPNWGDQVTFNVSTTATAEPHVDLTCSKGGVVVLGATTGFYASYPWPWTQIMTLSSPSWQSGAADCTATLYYFSGSRNTVLSTLRFTAGS